MHMSSLPKFSQLSEPLATSVPYNLFIEILNFNVNYRKVHLLTYLISV